jgi:hypothetical protein
MTIQKAEFVHTDLAGTAKRLDQIGWGIFLLVLNAIRSRLGVQWIGVSVALGVLALVAGLGDFTGIAIPLFPICLVIIGATLILKPLVFERA